VQFNLSALAPVEAELESCWPSLEDDQSQQLWEHEYEKHGSCCVRELPTELAYFEQALKLFGQFNLTALLPVEPSWERPTSLDELQSAVQRGVGYAPEVFCSSEKAQEGRTLLASLALCFSQDLTLRDCPQTQSDCGDGSEIFVPPVQTRRAATWNAVPRTLVVQAHPDDETAYVTTLYKLARDLGSVVDVVVVTDGQGGYNCSLAAEWLYDAQLTNDSVGRAALPDIRKREMLDSARVFGARRVSFLDQPDVMYTLNASEPLDEWWDTKLVLAQLADTLEQGAYDLVVVMLPDNATHGEHKAATILALEAVLSMQGPGPRPLVIGGAEGFVQTYTQPQGFPITSAPPESQFSFDRTSPIDARLNYTVIASMAMAQHRSQGCLIAELGSCEPHNTELFWYFDVNPPEGLPQVAAWFELLETTPFRPYGASAAASRASAAAGTVPNARPPARYK
jgi:LmbE family N-acetylglucosaminyl deacetylase